MRGGAINLSDLARPAKRSSLGAIIGNRNGGFPETLLRRFCITKLVTVIRLSLKELAVEKKREREK
jgi:hypothetical protein